MGQYANTIIFFNDEVGRVIPNATIETYKAGTTDIKNTYTDQTLVNANEWPTKSDARGVFPALWLESGGYRFVVKDKDGVVQFDRDNINVSESVVLATSALYSETTADLNLGILIDGSSINWQEGQVARTVGDASATDNGGAEWLIVAGGTGTDDGGVTFLDLNNGKQAQRLFNQLYTLNLLSEIKDAGASAQAEAVENLGLSPAAVSGYVRADNVFYRDDNGNAEVAKSNTGTETVGKTGSGADYILASLDSLPLDTTHVLIRAHVNINATTISTSASTSLWLYRNGGSQYDFDYFPTYAPNTGNNYQSAQDIWVPIDDTATMIFKVSSNVISGGTGSAVTRLTLIGYATAR
jgi:hypothetical protein